MGGKLHAIREACGLDPDMRTEEHINEILDFVKDVKFFARLSVLQQRTLCRTMSLEEFGPREFVFQMGDNGEKFYIILQGSVGVQVPSQTAPCPNDICAEKCDCPNRPLETVVFLEKGMGFGELALQSDQPRSATIQTSEKTELLVTKRSDYEMYAGQLHRQFIEQRVKFLRQCPRIEDALQMGLVSTQDIAAMANCLNEMNLAGNAVACRQGDIVDHMIFVRSGQLAMLRCVDLDQKFEARPSTYRAKQRSSQGRMTIGGKVVPPTMEQLETKRTVAGGQPRWLLTQNLAKAMMEMKKKDRKQKLDIIAIQQKEAEEAEAESHNVYEEIAGPEFTLFPKGGREQTFDGPTKFKGIGTLLGSKQEEGESVSGGSALWARLRLSVKTATALTSFVDNVAVDQVDDPPPKVVTINKPRSSGSKAPPESDKKNARKSSPRARRSQAGRLLSPGDAAKGTGKRVRILRIGTVGPYQYFGDQQVCNNESYPVSLVSDPVAEVYAMSKHDILRRVPKKLFSALFTPEKEAVPSDGILLEMHRQTERWNAFRRSMHGEALCNLGTRNHVCGGPRALRDQCAESRIDAFSNLEFLGINPHSELGESLLVLPQNKGVALTPKDEELFSQASAEFLRKFDEKKRDPGVRLRLASAGLMRNSRLHDGLPGSALDDDDMDPMAFRFDQHWYKLQKDPIGLDLDDVLSEDTAKANVGAPFSMMANTGSTRGSVRATQRRASTADSSAKRTSGSGGLGETSTSMPASTMMVEGECHVAKSPFGAPPGSAPNSARRRSKFPGSRSGGSNGDLPSLSDGFTPHLGNTKEKLMTPPSAVGSIGRRQVAFESAVKFS